MKFRNRILQAVSPKEASLLLALMIGDTDLMSPEQDELYKQIGAQHLLAVSGLQVSLLAVLCFFILTPVFVILLGLSRAHRAQALAALMTLALTLWFVGLAGFSSSAMRAFLMTTCLLVPTIFARKIDIVLIGGIKAKFS
jgi:competence protein ComEC